MLHFSSGKARISCYVLASGIVLFLTGLQVLAQTATETEKKRDNVIEKPCKPDNTAREYLTCNTMPSPRFTRNDDGTVLDHATGLIWLENADCFDATSLGEGMKQAALLEDGYQCKTPPHLNDGSKKGAWRIPNRRELESLFDYRFSSPVVSNAAGDKAWRKNGDAFSNIKGKGYWTSTLTKGRKKSKSAWRIKAHDGNLGKRSANSKNFSWPVRDP